MLKLSGSVGALALLVACSSAGQDGTSREQGPLGAFVADPGKPLPARLSELGLYDSDSGLSALLPALEYEPGYPLWSDGGEKRRAIALPEGSSIDAGDPRRYEFPAGTLIAKTFAYRTPASPAQIVPVETRILRRSAGAWELSAYAWDDAGQDAELLDLKRSQTRQVLDDSGELIEHSIPSRLECRQCHESSDSEVLGINELQLARSGSLDALADRISPPPTAPFQALPSHGPLTQAVLGYFVGNCSHCHNGSNGAASSFDLRPQVALQNLVNVPTESSATADGIRVVPGEPDQSVLFLGVRAEGELEVKKMPPLGVARRDDEAVRLLREFITALATETDP